MKKFSKSEIEVSIKRMENATRKQYDSYAFSSKFLGQILTQAMSDLPAFKQAEIMRRLEDITAMHSPEVVV
jgi:hypothetical protein